MAFDYMPVLPEIVVLVGACVILLVDVWLGDDRRHVGYWLAQFTLLIANATGIYGVYSYREVFEFKEFWSIGSGRSFALGAMHAVYARARNARDVAQAGLAAGCEFDRSTAAPLDIVTLKLKAGA